MEEVTQQELITGRPPMNEYLLHRETFHTDSETFPVCAMPYLRVTNVGEMEVFVKFKKNPIYFKNMEMRFAFPSAPLLGSLQWAEPKKWEGEQFAKGWWRDATLWLTVTVLTEEA